MRIACDSGHGNPIQIHAGDIQEHDGNQQNTKPEQEIQVPPILEVVSLEIPESPHTVCHLPHLQHRRSSRRVAHV